MNKNCSIINSCLSNQCCGYRGPQGATGAVGVILGSYDSIEDLIFAHPTGNQGDTYIVDGELYVWDEQTQSWNSVGNIQGPTGPQGPTGAVGVILGSYDSIEDLIFAHPTGNQGDTYIVDGELYVWDEQTQSWDSIGNIQGPTGPQGPTGSTGAGIEILGVYETLADLIAAHPIGNIGDAYIIDGIIYVWDTDTNSWLPAGPTGAQGPTGSTGAGIEILGVYETLAGLIAAHPTGNIGDAYIVNGIIYVWDTDTNSWLPAGPTGAQGPTGPQGRTGEPGAAASSVTIIPFASQQAPHVGTNNAGEAVNVALIGFGYMEYSTTGIANIAIPIDTNDKSFSMSAEVNRQVAFSLPFDMILNSLYITVGNWGTFPFPPTGTLVYPYVQIYAAPAGSNTFFPIESAVAKPEQGIDPLTAAAATMRAASVDGLNINLRAGTRIAICGMMEITGDTESREYYLYFNGGIGMTRFVE